MIPKLEAAKHLGGYRVRLEFTDGSTGDLDLEGELWGEVFGPVRDPEYFKQFEVHPELNTLTWPNGADFSPEYLYQAIAA